MRSWIGLYALLWMIRDAGMTDFTREGITAMLAGGQGRADAGHLRRRGLDAGPRPPGHLPAGRDQPLGRSTGGTPRPTAPTGSRATSSRPATISFDEMHVRIALRRPGAMLSVVVDRAHGGIVEEQQVSLVQRLRQLATDEPDARVYMHVGDRRRPSGRSPRAELDRRSSQLAGALAARGVGLGDRVALGLRNSPELMLAASRRWKVGRHADPGALGPARLGARISCGR